MHPSGQPPGATVAVERWDITDAINADVSQLSDVANRLNTRYSLSLGVSRGLNHIGVEFQAVQSQVAKCCELLKYLAALIEIQRNIENIHSTAITPYTSSAGDWMLTGVDAAPSQPTQPVAVITEAHA